MYYRWGSTVVEGIILSHLHEAARNKAKETEKESRLHSNGQSQ